jgi:hypothetical protein
MFVLSSPGSLSTRALEFLRKHASRQPFDPGLGGDELRHVIGEVYGRPNERMVSLLESVQARYGGLAYPSGFFDTDVVFLPVCEPEDADAELEISYAVRCEGPASASLSADGTVFVGRDGNGVAEFASLDAVIECDAMFPLASHMAATMTSFLRSAAQVAQLAGRLRADGELGLREVREACGAHTFWFAGRSAMVYMCGAWSGTPPLVKVWGATNDSLNAAQQLVWS